jgi:peptidoglycan-N-acetylglucosamine deacetylase
MAVRVRLRRRRRDSLAVALILLALIVSGIASSHRSARADCVPDEACGQAMAVLAAVGDSNDNVPSGWRWPDLPTPKGAAWAAADRLFPPRVVLPLLAADGRPSPPPPPPGPVLYLTFDDGPQPIWTVSVLEVLARYEAKATFFLIGANIDAYPGLPKAAVEAGHEVGIHSYSHADLTKLSRDAVGIELAKAQAALQRATGRTTTCMRPPYGAVNPTLREIVASRGLTLWLWNVDPRDWARPGVAEVVNVVRSSSYPGAVVLFHDGGGDRSQTVAALDQLLSYFRTRGYSFEPLPC